MDAGLGIGTLIAAFVVAVLVAVAGTPVVSRLARALRVVDQPGDRSVNERLDVPLMGGMAIALGVFVGLSVGVVLAGRELHLSGHLEAIWIGGLLILGIGVYDDRFGASARSKLFFQVAAAGVAIFFGFRIGHFTDPISETTWMLPTWLMVLVTTFWIVGITNAMNLIDGLDGLCTGVGGIIAATLTIVCWQGGEWVGVLFGVTLVGATLGFLPFNFSPARIFLGDTGALFIGYALSLLALEGYRQLSLLTFLVPILALAVPLLDTGLSVLRRLRRRENIFSADRAHMHHRLLQFQGNQRSAVLSIYFLTACFCVIALSFTNLRGYVAVVVVFVVILLTLRLLRNLGFFEMDSAELPAADGESGVEGQKG
jgi:UDP-GlcNAc:undecaprenyl-phosphate GlcNAc-1-phosphate transferase